MFMEVYLLTVKAPSKQLLPLKRAPPLEKAIPRTPIKKPSHQKSPLSKRALEKAHLETAPSKKPFPLKKVPLEVEKPPLTQFPSSPLPLSKKSTLKKNTL